MMLEELQRRNYAETTTRHYIRTVEVFARRFNRPPDRLGPRHIREYQAELFQKRKLSPNSVIRHLAALKFEIASLSKQFTAAALLQLADSGKLNVEDPVSKYYPEAPASWKGMTIHHLLHTSGLPENEWGNFYKGKCTTYSTEEQVKTFRDRPLGFPPGSAWKYRNTEYYLLAYIIE
jgi:CubicO group peptidase (beta-lactamase class C family)